MREIKFEYLFFTEDKNFQRKIVLDLEDIEHGRFALEQITTICDKSKTIRRQYTGLKDKNGREIYEGDILENKTILKELEEYVNVDNRYCKVIFEVGSFRLEFPHDRLCKEIEEIEEIGFYNLDNYEVIGNIYENPELLNERK